MSHLKLLQTQSCPILSHCLRSVPSKQNHNMAFIGPFLSPKDFISHVNFKLRRWVQIFTVCVTVNGLISYFTQEINNCFLETLSSDEYSKNVSFLKLKTWFLHLETHFLCLETWFIQILTLESRLSTYFWAVLKYSPVRDTMYKVPRRLIIIIKYSASKCKIQVILGGIRDFAKDDYYRATRPLIIF